VKLEEVKVETGEEDEVSLHHMCCAFMVYFISFGIGLSLHTSNNISRLTTPPKKTQEVLCSFRSKMFLYGETLLDKGTGNKTWKERGIGEARILRHREHQRLRFLMRQEKTMKVLANHALDPRIQLEPNTGSDRSWVWSCYDFAEGELEEKVFALRFANSDVAQEFKDKFEECQKEMAKVLAGEDKPDESGEVAEAAEALGGLKTNEE
jgi:Ran-binding protein 1